jgi:hypothetical protein
MQRRHAIPANAVALNDLSVDGNRMRVTGQDPFAIYDLTALGASGSDAGLLRFVFQCDEQKAPPRLQVFWWGDDLPGPRETHSLHFEARDGVLIVPLDAAHRWTMTQRVSGFRIDLDNPAACAALRIGEIELYSRVFD